MHYSCQVSGSAFEDHFRFPDGDSSLDLKNCDYGGSPCSVVAEWALGEPKRPFGTIEQMTAEARELRVDHNYVEADSIVVIATALWQQVDRAKLESVLVSMDPAAYEQEYYKLKKAA